MQALYSFLIYEIPQDVRRTNKNLLTVAELCSDAGNRAKTKMEYLMGMKGLNARGKLILFQSKREREITLWTTFY